MGVIKSIIVTVILAYVVRHLYFTFVKMGVGVKYLNHRPGPCRAVPGISCGSEQIASTKDGLAFITSGYKDLTICDEATLTGRIYKFDYNNPGENVTELKIVSDTLNLKDFAPHGMDILEKEEGMIKLYVVSHILDEESVEVFLYDRSEPSILRHHDTLKDATFANLNDLTLVAEDEFYATNMLAYRQISKLFYTIEPLFEMRTGNVVHYKKGSGGKVVVDKLQMANGITSNPDKSLIFVMEVLAKIMTVYARNTVDNSLSKVASHDTVFGLDNIFYDPQSHIILGAGTKHGYKLIFKKEERASSFVAKIASKDDKFKDIELTEVFHDDGQMVFGASSAHLYQKKMLVGTVYGNLAFCEVKSSDL